MGMDVLSSKKDSLIPQYGIWAGYAMFGNIFYEAVTYKFLFSNNTTKILLK
jgi:hypothetical protein